MSGIFITGTDTEVGKTIITAGLLVAARRSAASAIGMKPVASGALPSENGLRNDDAITLIEHSSPQLDYSMHNPITFEAPASPNIAALKSSVTVSLEILHSAYARCSDVADIVLVEGIGGWRVPLSQTLQTVDLVRRLNVPAILVVGLRLGCISHALLTVESINHDGIELLGWVANAVDQNYAYSSETLATLTERIHAPLLAHVEWQDGEVDLEPVADALAPCATSLWS